MPMKKTREKSSGNVFADLGLPDSEQELLKAKLTVQIYRLIRARGLTQSKAADLLDAGAGFGADALPAGLGFRRPPDGVPDRARPGCRSHRPASAAPQIGAYVGGCRGGLGQGDRGL
jgi:hypothetical protein